MKIMRLVVAIAICIAMFAAMSVTVFAASESHIDTTLLKTAELQESNSDHEEIDFVPLFNQRDYKDPYGDYGTISSHGCGIASLAMVYSYMTDEIHLPDELAKQFGDYNTKHGSLWTLFQDSAEELGIPFVKSDASNGEWYSWKKIKEALSNGQPVICLQREGIFTGGGHYIVLTGITEDGKILVNDPNGKNWTKNKTLAKGFDNGFKPSQIKESAVAYWIYGEKEQKKEVEEKSTEMTSNFYAEMMNNRFHLSFYRLPVMFEDIVNAKKRTFFTDEEPIIFVPYLPAIPLEP
jgi:hypothetical protein